jgi:ribosomal protein S18 acetylase RimI-like enzyme
MGARRSEMIHVTICTQDDVAALAQMNRMLIEDEKAENSMSLPQLEERMVGFLNTSYRAFFFEVDGERVGYALVDMSKAPLYLRQFFIRRESRRMGFGKMAFSALLEHLKTQEIDIDVYAWNQRGISFWKSLGFTERCYNMRFRK